MTEEFMTNVFFIWVSRGAMTDKELKLAATARYAHEDGPTAERLQPEDLIHPSAIDLSA
jgi:hypothetical protein